MSWEGQKSADICSRRDPHLGSESTKIKKIATKAVDSIWLPHNCILLHHKYVQGIRPASLVLSRKRKIFGYIVYLIPKRHVNVVLERKNRGINNLIIKKFAKQSYSIKFPKNIVISYDIVHSQKSIKK